MNAGSSQRIRLTLCLAALAAIGVVAWTGLSMKPARAGIARYKVLPPVAEGNLAIFPVVGAVSHDTTMFLTLDEGLRSGEVVVTEAGEGEALIRRRPVPRPRPGGAEVSRLVLVNNSSRPLLLLAGEIITGGKQDRVVGKSRIVPAGGGPVDLSVFCVEPGRWVAKSDRFSIAGAPMAQPSVRGSALARKSQKDVWSEVRESAAAVVGEPADGRGAFEVGGISTTSYATLMGTEEARKRLDSVVVPLQRSYEKVARELERHRAIGVVAAINGEIVWADIFASGSLLEKYWPKLVRSYAAEALTRSPAGRNAELREAESFLEDFAGTRQTVEIEPGVYRHTEAAGEGFHAFELESLLPMNDFTVHISKMAD